jgi:small subunit ribosomal protein S9
MPRKKKEETKKEEEKPTQDEPTTSSGATPSDEQDKGGGGIKKKTTKKATKEKFLIGTGRRKTAIAGVWLKNEKGPILVNGRAIEEYFPSEKAKKIYEEPLRVVNRLGQYSGTIKLSGGGGSAQLIAVVHGISRALASQETSFREILSKKKFLTRDSRMKERRKYGHAGKARKKKQSPKR